jgi:hypothetical protein
MADVAIIKCRCFNVRAICHLKLTIRVQRLISKCSFAVVVHLLQYVLYLGGRYIGGFM